MTRKHVVIAVGLVIAGLSALPSRADVEPQGKAKMANPNMVLAARKAKEAALAMHDVGRASLEDVYRWSRRVIEADNFAPQSVADHLALMRNLHARADAMNKAGAPGGEELWLHATAYYVAEAENLAAAK
jgi:hypothetical protein